MKRLAFIFVGAAVIAHALMSLAAGSAVPGDWSPLQLWGCILIVAPFVALALAVLAGIFAGTFVARPATPTVARRRLTAAERRALHHRDT